MRKRFILALTGFLAISLLFTSIIQVAAAPNTNAASRKIVVFQESVSQAAQDQIIGRAGAEKVKHLGLVNATVVMVTPANEKALTARPEVLRIEDDAIATILGKPNNPGSKPPPTQPAETLPWGVDRIDAELAWDGSTGAGVKVAIVDTGIDLTHPDLAANIKGGINTINPSKTPNDDNGHGSHVAGTIAGIDNEIGVIGVAPGANLYAVKVLGKSGSGWFSDIIEGIQWSIDNNMDVINMSLGSSSDVQSFHDAIIAAYEAGIVIVAAAGNSGPGDNTVGYPAAYPEVIAVSATASNDLIASFSSRGPQVDLAAPGVSIFSTVKGGGYATYNGTSMASPHVAGVTALIVATGITDPDLVRAKLQSTADDLGSGGPDSLYGYGLVDAKEAATGTP